MTVKKMDTRPCVFTRACRFAPFVAAAAIMALGTFFITAGPAGAAGSAPEPRRVDWSFNGPFGTYDRAQLRRGLMVYQQVCAACHGMDLVKFRNLSESGGPEFSEEQVKIIAADYEITDGPDSEGDMFERTRLPKDPFPAPFANEQAARASNNGAWPPDFSVLAKARPGGADYIYSLLVGYTDPPEGFPMSDGMHYNRYFAGYQIAMAAPLVEEQVDYEDGTPMTVDQYARDVSAFMMWAAEPKLEARHSLGFQVLIYLLILTGMLFFVGRKLWAEKAAADS